MQQRLLSPQIKREDNKLNLELFDTEKKTSDRQKDTFMKDLLGFRLNNPTAFSHKAFGSERLALPRPKKEGPKIKLNKI